MCPGKERQSSTLVQKCWKTTKRKQDTEKKNYQGNLIKVQINMMNIKDHGEEQEDMEISEKEDGTACNICRTLLWNTYTKKEMWLVFNIYEIIRPCVVDLLLLVIFYPNTSMRYALII